MKQRLVVLTGAGFLFYERFLFDKIENDLTFKSIDFESFIVFSFCKTEAFPEGYTGCKVLSLGLSNCLISLQRSDFSSKL